MTDQLTTQTSQRHFVTRRYNRLQGLRAVLSGGYFLILAAFTWVSLDAERGRDWFPVMAVLLLISGAAMIWGDLKLKAWYGRKFGNAVPLRSNAIFDWTSFAVLMIILGLSALLVALTSLTYPFVFFAIALSALLLAVVEKQRFGGWRPYSIAYGLGTAAAALITWQLALREPQEVNVVLFTCAGFAMIAGGLADHQKLFRSLGSPVKEVEVAE